METYDFITVANAQRTRRAKKATDFSVRKKEITQERTRAMELPVR